MFYRAWKAESSRSSRADESVCISEVLLEFLVSLIRLLRSQQRQTNICLISWRKVDRDAVSWILGLLRLPQGACRQIDGGRNDMLAENWTRGVTRVILFRVYSKPLNLRYCIVDNEFSYCCWLLVSLSITSFYDSVVKSTDREIIWQFRWNIAAYNFYC